MKNLKITLRSLLRYKRYSFINIISLSLSMAVALIVFQFSTFQLSFDKYLDNDIYRIVANQYDGDKLLQKSTVTFSGVGPAMLEDIPAVKSQTRIFPFGNSIVKVNQTDASEISRSVAVEPAFFSMFETNLLAGNKETIFQNANEIVLTASSADRIFNNSRTYNEMIGEQVRLDNDQQFTTIVGIIEDLPANSHLQYNLFMSYETIIQTWGLPQARFDWNMIDFRHYIQVENTTAQELNAALINISEKHLQQNELRKTTFEVQALDDIYLSDENIAYDVAIKGDKQTVLILISLGVVILLIGWMNYANLSTAHALEKSKFIGIKKALGASRRIILQNQLLEVAIINSISLGIGVLLSYLFTSALQSRGFVIYQLSEIIDKGYLYNPLLIALMLAMIIGLIVSTLVSHRISLRIKAKEAIKVRSGQKLVKSNNMSGALLVFQSLLSLVVFSLGLLVYQQQKHILNIPLGMEIENTYVLGQPKLTRTDSAFQSQLNTFKNNLLSHSGVQSITSLQRTPGQQLQVDYRSQFNGEEKPLAYLISDEDYLETFNLTLIAGRNFDRSEVGFITSEARHTIINEEALTELGFQSPQQALGQRITILGSPKEIIGVISNIRQQPIQYDFEATAIIPGIHSNHQIAIQANLPSAQLSQIVEESYRNAFIGNSFSFRSIEEEYYLHYEYILQAQYALTIIAVLAILISLIGMISMASINLISRLKEIGIRKVLGATDAHLVWGVIKKYNTNVLIALLASIPIIIFIGNAWLDQFNDSIGINSMHIIIPTISLIAAVSICLALISMKTVSTNPADTLRQE